MTFPAASTARSFGAPVVLTCLLTTPAMSFSLAFPGDWVSFRFQPLERFEETNELAESTIWSVTTPTASVAVIVRKPALPFGSFLPDGFGPFVQVTAGAVVSCTVTVNDPDELLFAASVAVHVTVVVPSGNVLPEAGEQLTTGDGSRSSVAVAVYVTAAPDALVASAVMLAGSCRTGRLIRDQIDPDHAAVETVEAVR